MARAISKEMKRKIMEEVKEGGVVYKEVAGKYGVSTSTIRMWRRGDKESGRGGFVEAELMYDKGKVSDIEKVVLEYGGIKVTIEGEISKNKEKIKGIIDV